MPDEDDKYPTETGRRRFVKGVVGGATLAGLGTATAAMVNAATSPTGKGGGITQFFGIENTAGPAPRGMPMIPVRIDGEGYLKGLWPEVKTITERGQQVTIAEQKLGGITYSSEWFQYCGVQTYPGVRPEADQDNFFRSAPSPPYQWQQEQKEDGEKLHVDDFSDYENWGNGIGRPGMGKPAMGNWRSVDLPPQETMPVQVLRIPPDDLQQLKQKTQFPEWLDAATQENFMAWLNKCTHFCCVPGFKATPQSVKFNAANEVYCPCHQSVYDPYSVIQKSFVALPRPE